MFWNRKPKVEEVMKPGKCECEHERCCHEKGKGKCHASFPPDKEWPYGSGCACQVFILDDDDDAGPLPETPTPSELEKIYQL